MSANRSNIAWHLAHMKGGRDLVPELGEAGYAAGAVAIRTNGTAGFGNGIYINEGDADSCNFISTDGLSAILNGGAEQTPYEISTTQNYLAGSRCVLRTTGLERVFRYAKASNIAPNQRQGLKFYNQLADGVDYVAATAGVIGDTSITITAATKTLNQLRGGHLIIHTHTDEKHQFFGIKGNTATNTAGTITIYLDGPLTHTITTSHGVEVWLNPYSNVRHPGDGLQHTTVAGIPLVHTVVANTWLWLQTWGPIWGNPEGTTTYAMVRGERNLVFNEAGSVMPATDAAGSEADVDMQHAGVILDRTTTGTGAGSMMLEVCP